MTCPACGARTRVVDTVSSDSGTDYRTIGQDVFTHLLSKYGKFIARKRVCKSASCSWFGYSVEILVT